MRDRIAKSLFWVVWSRGFVQLVSFVTTLLVARLLEPADYGLMALVGVWTYAIALMAELGLGLAIVQFPDLEERELNTCFWLVVGMAGVGYLSLYASAPAIAAWFASPRLADVLRVGALSLPLVAVRTVPDSLLRKRLEIDRISQADIAGVLVTVPVVLGLAWSGAGVWALVAGTLTTPLVQTFVLFWFVTWRPGFRVGSRRFRDIFRYSAPVLGARVGWAAYQHVDALVLGKIAGETVLGFYSMARLMAMLPVDKISAVANQLALPIMAGLQADRATMRLSFLRGLRLVASLTVPSCVGMALVADDFVSIALAERWKPIVPLMQVLCLFGLMRSLDILLPPILFARYRPGFMFWWTAGLLLVMPFAFWAGAVRLGAIGVALALVVVYPVFNTWLAREAFKELELSWKAVWRQLRPVMGASIMMVISVLTVHSTVPVSDSLDRLTRFGLAVGCGALVYALALFRWGGPLVREIADVAGWVLPRRALLNSRQ